MAVDIFSRIHFLPTPPPPSLFGLFPSLPRSLSLTQVTVICNQCVPKAGFGAAALSSSLYFVVCHLEPRKVSWTISCKALRWDIYVINTIRRAVCIVQCLPLFSFHLTTNHPDPRWNRKVWHCSLLPGDNKVLPRKQGYNKSQIYLAKTFFLVWKQSLCWTADRVSSLVREASLNKTSVREMSRGVYLPKTCSAFFLIISWYLACVKREKMMRDRVILSVPRKCMFEWFPGGVDRKNTGCDFVVEPLH